MRKATPNGDAMPFLEIALRNSKRRFRVIPLRGKEAFLKRWPELATTDEAQIREWAVKFPDYNCGVAGGSDVIILDSDRVSRLKELCGDSWVDWFHTYSVSSGRLDRAHYYFLATPEVLEFGNRKHEEPGIKGNIFEIKGRGTQATAEGSTHPDTGGTYAVVQDLPLIPFPLELLALLREMWQKSNPTGKREWNLPVHDSEGRDDFLISQAGRLRNAGASEAVIRAHLDEINSDPAIMADPKSEEDLDRIARSAARYDVPAPPPEVIIGSALKHEEKIVTDWRSRYHTKDDALNAPPISFLIDGFLQREGVTAIAGPVRERKSLIALNVAHALVTGEPLFDHFKVVKKPSRVLYLCPEVSLGPFTDRVKKIGLLDYVGETFFYRTLSADGTVKLSELDEELPGSVVFLDTAIRFLEGKENDSGDVRKFADGVFDLLRGGAESVVMLHHSPKESGEFMTLENAMRGSGDMGAFLACCWGTRLQDPTKPYESASFLSNLKQRDFESRDFEVTSGPDCRLHIVGDPTTREVSLASRKGNKANKDGKDDAAEAVIRAHANTPIRKLQEELAALGIKRGTTWIGNARARILGTGVTCGEVA